MNHFSYEQWMTYVKNELDEKVREVYEDHLYSCDHCLEIYLEALAECENDLPIMTSGDDFADRVMAQVAQDSVPAKKKTIPFYQRTFFHYAIAAAVTILLMTTGVFQSITKYVDTVQSPNFQQKDSSLTEGIVNKTFAWMDAIDRKNKEANK